MSEGLATFAGTDRILKKYGIRARKKYGQNFLISESAVEDILDAAALGPDDCVLEVGPGIGTLTGYLSERARHVVSVEIDMSLAPVLAETLADCGNVTILWQDVLKTDIGAIAREYNGGRPLKVVANLPYYVTTPILMQLLENGTLFEGVTLMVQKEVADRICAPAGSRDAGAITYAVQYYAVPSVRGMVPPSSFIPRPAVESCILHLDVRESAPVEADRELLFALIRAAFNQRRKTLANAVSHGFELDGRRISREEAAAALARAGLPETVRGEAMGLEEFAAFARELDAAPAPEG